MPLWLWEYLADVYVLAGSFIPAHQKRDGVSVARVIPASTLMWLLSNCLASVSVVLPKQNAVCFSAFEDVILGWVLPHESVGQVICWLGTGLALSLPALVTMWRSGKGTVTCISPLPVPLKENPYPECRCNGTFLLFCHSFLYLSSNALPCSFRTGRTDSQSYGAGTGEKTSSGGSRETG